MMSNLLRSIQTRTSLGWLQLWRDKPRLVVAVAGIAFADILIFMQFGFRQALYDTNTMFQRRLNADIVLISPQARELTRLFTFPRRRLYQALDIPGVAEVQALYVNFLDWRNPQTHKKAPLLVIGQDPVRPAFDIPGISEQLEKIKLPDRVLFDQAARGTYQEVVTRFEAGETVTAEIDRRTVTVAGLFKMGASFAVDGTLITSDQTFLALFPKREPGTVSMGIIQVKPGIDPLAVTIALRNYLPDDVMVLTHDEYITFELNYLQQRTPIGFVFGLGSAMGFIVGVVIVYQILSTDVNDHMVEYATFKAMGYRNTYLLGVIFEEAIVLAVLGFMPGLGASLGLYGLARKATALPMFMPLTRVIWVFVLTVMMCGLSGAIASRRLQAADPADIF
jgi:putative ABC transport system permease protein